MANKLQFIIIFGIFVLGGLYLYTESTGQSVSELISSGTKPMRIKNVPLQVIVVQTPEERKQGLSGRDEIGADGMLFVFDESDYHGIWMKGMHFAIDVIWISEDLEVIDISRNLLPESYPKIFEPPEPARYALETRPYLADTFSFRKGDKVILPPGL